MVGCWIWQLCYCDDMVTLERLRYNLVGGLLPFGMGLLAARSEKLKEMCGKLRLPLYAVLFMLSILFAFYFSLLSPQMWLWVPALAVVGTMALVKLMPQWLMPSVVWLGTISAAIFVMHPLVRKIFIRPYLQYDQYAGLLLFIVATLLVSWLVKKMIDKMPKPTL